MIVFTNSLLCEISEPSTVVLLIIFIISFAVIKLIFNQIISKVDNQEEIERKSRISEEYLLRHKYENERFFMLIE